MLAGCLTIMVFSFSAALTEVPGKDSHIPSSKQQFFSASNSTGAAEIEKSALTSSTRRHVIIELADDVSHFFRQYATTQRFRNASTLYPNECLTDFLNLFSSKRDISKGYKMLDASGRPGPYILGGNFHITGSFDECLNIEGGLTQYCFLLFLPLVNDTLITFHEKIVTFMTEVCLPRSCNTRNLEFLVAELNAYFIRNYDKYSILYVANSAKYQDSKRVPFNTGAIVMMVVCLLFLSLSLVGTAVDLSMVIFNWLMEKPEFSQRFSQTGSDSGNSAAEGTPISTQAPATSSSGKNRFDIYAPLEKHLKLITAFSIIKNLEMIISTKQPANTITCFSGIRVISMSWIILVHTFIFQVNRYNYVNKHYIVRNYEPKIFLPANCEW